jgi:hypothetical protein
MHKEIKRPESVVLTSENRNGIQILGACGRRRRLISICRKFPPVKLLNVIQTINTYRRRRKRPLFSFECSLIFWNTVVIVAMPDWCYHCQDIFHMFAYTGGISPVVLQTKSQPMHYSHIGLWEGNRWFSIFRVLTSVANDIFKINNIEISGSHRGAPCWWSSTHFWNVVLLH